MPHPLCCFELLVVHVDLVEELVVGVGELRFLIRELLFLSHELQDMTRLLL